ncbi:cupin domain-containing protein [Cyanobacterium sp. Dongsha4]|uniref:cupin domain-containing protein n=1 Tax=Cyanobacterium sp. DS4 TaxID=2878255 RepID=UPI002E81AF93|nr:cupin domain-containing protein [Cyanobacterium sp. Dongsha4]WVL01292.1 cupin domain-containing protein [Cyanobacterium sp. Dongsha4]
MEYISLKELPNQSVSHNQSIKKKTILNKGKLPHITNFSQAIFAPKQVAYVHNHDDMWEVFYVEKGTGIIKINEREYILEKGVCVLVEPNENHEIINNGDDNLIINYFGVVN